MKALHMIPEKCTACMQCELACSWHQTGMFNPAKSAIRAFVFDEEARYVPFTCLQCDEAWCMMVCPVDAISVDANTGARVVSDGACVGCKVCTIACPFGTIFFNSDTGKVFKCDLCDGAPMCVQACPAGAIEYRDVDTVGHGKMRVWVEKLDDAYRKEVR
jgi:Fe-S-cluster-containing hydrogenase component 2